MTDTTDPAANETDADSVPHGAVLCAVDFSGDSRAAVKWAYGFAACFETQLLVLHVIHDPLDAPGYYKQVEGEHLRPMEDVAEAMMQEFLFAALGIAPEDAGAVPVRTKLTVGVPVPRILEVAKKIDAQIIVMGSQGRTGLKHLLIGSKAEQIVRLSPIPVTIVKEPVQ